MQHNMQQNTGFFKAKSYHSLFSTKYKASNSSAKSLIRPTYITPLARKQGYSKNMCMTVSHHIKHVLDTNVDPQKYTSTRISKPMLSVIPYSYSPLNIIPQIQKYIEFTTPDTCTTKYI